MSFARLICAAWALVGLAGPSGHASAADGLPPPPEPATVSIITSDIDPIGTDITASLPPLPDPAPVVINARDVVEAQDATGPVEVARDETRISPPEQAPSRSFEASLPEPPEPADVILDIAATPHEEPATRLTASLAPASPDVPATSETLPTAPDTKTETPASGPATPRQIAIAPQAQPGVSLAAIAARIDERIGEAARHPRLPQREQDAIRAFYASRAFEPAWVTGEGLSQAGLAVRAQLGRAGEDGLRPGDYLVRPAGTSAEALADAEVRMAVAAVLYARDARGGRLDPRRISIHITPKLALPDAQSVLSTLVTSADPAAALAGFQPQHAGYRHLKARLAEFHRDRTTQEPAVRLPAGQPLRLGMRDERVPLLRARFGLDEGDGRTYDRSLATVVADFQRENGLPGSGVLNRATLDALNGGSSATLEGDLIANMERWRWLPGDLGEEHLFVNVPEYMVRKIEGGQVIHSARVIVGKTERPTPIFSDEMDHLVLNPSWTLPPTILRKDVLPKLATDPGYAERRGFEVIRRGNNITVRQPPGPTNALGNIKFMFPNDHAVYLHDTPNRNLFGTARRAYSSGCVRVEQPLKLAELVLNGESGNWSEQRLRSLVGSGERTIRLTRKLPIHIAYMTHVVDADGNLQTYEDIYGFHRRTREALGL